MFISIIKSLLLLCVVAPCAVPDPIANDFAHQRAGSPNELIARGEYQAAIEELTAQLAVTGGSGMDNDRAALLSNLGIAYNKLGRYADAESNLNKALRIWKGLGLDGTERCATTLNNLANVFLNQRRYAQAEEMFKRALAMYRNGSDDTLNDKDTPDEKRLAIALLLNNLGLTTLSSGMLADAEQLFLESLQMQEQMHDSKHLPATLNNLAFSYKVQGRLELAASMYGKAIEAWHANFDSAKDDVASGLHNLAVVEVALGRYSQADQHFSQALAMVDATLPAVHPIRIAILDGYGGLLTKLRRKHEAKQIQALARAIRAQYNHENFQDLTVSIKQIAR